MPLMLEYYVRWIFIFFRQISSRIFPAIFNAPYWKNFSCHFVLLWICIHVRYRTLVLSTTSLQFGLSSLDGSFYENIATLLRIFYSPEDKNRNWSSFMEGVLWQVRANQVGEHSGSMELWSISYIRTFCSNRQIGEDSYVNCLPHRSHSLLSFFNFSFIEVMLVRRTLK